MPSDLLVWHPDTEPFSVDRELDFSHVSDLLPLDPLTAPQTPTSNPNKPETYSQALPSCPCASDQHSLNLPKDAGQDSGRASYIFTAMDPDSISPTASSSQRPSSTPAVPTIMLPETSSSAPNSATVPHTEGSTFARELRQPNPLITTQSPADALNSPSLETSPTGERFEFGGIDGSIPTGALENMFSADQISFSKRGSILLSTRKANPALTNAKNLAPLESSTSLPAIPRNYHHSPNVASDRRSITADDRRLSQRVRSYYDLGDEHTLDSLAGRPLPVNPTVSRPADSNSRDPSPSDTVTALPQITSPKPSVDSPNPSSRRRNSSAPSIYRNSFVKKEPWEAAGGMEDWRGVDFGSVDRYGFIIPKVRSSGESSRSSQPGSPETQNSDTANTGHSSRHNKLQRSQPPSTSRSRHLSPLSNSGRGSRNSSRGPTPSISSHSKLSISTFGSTSTARGRGWVAEARTMIGAPLGKPGPPSFPEESKEIKESREKQHRKRSNKWKDMAVRATSSKSARHPNRLSGHSQTGEKPVVGAGDSWTFNSSDEVLIRRVWKGIPDDWRSTAWHSFLTTSARRQAGLLGVTLQTDEELIALYESYQTADCPDDPQIDMDVPRTVGQHISFRTRYRGGQRNLWRVLRALALHFPETGYVQGMAPLAATLVVYYTEEMAFVMGVRMWKSRGLEDLFSPGFEGLMRVLGEFETDWLGMKHEKSSVGSASQTGQAGGLQGQGQSQQESSRTSDKKKGKKAADEAPAGLPVAEHLAELCVAPTSYGTKWFLTLFNYSLPPEAQLRVWDVFMLFGGAETLSSRDLGHPMQHKRRQAANGAGEEVRPKSAPAHHKEGSRDEHAEPEEPSAHPAPSTSHSTQPQHDSLDPASSDGSSSSQVPLPANYAPLHAVALSLLDAMQDHLLSSDFESAMKALTAYVPIRPGKEDVMMRVARKEWKEWEKKRAKSGRAAS